jgi:hypothetical protein
MAAPKDAPGPEGAGSGAGTRQPKSTSGNSSTGVGADESLAILRDAQAVMRGVARTIDRMSAAAAALAGGAQ